MVEIPRSAKTFRVLSITSWVAAYVEGHPRSSRGFIDLREFSPSMPLGRPALQYLPLPTASGCASIQPFSNIRAIVCRPAGCNCEISRPCVPLNFCKAVRSMLCGRWLGRGGNSLQPRFADNGTISNPVFKKSSKTSLRVDSLISSPLVRSPTFDQAELLRSLAQLRAVCLSQMPRREVLAPHSLQPIAWCP